MTIAAIVILLVVAGVFAKCSAGDPTYNWYKAYSNTTEQLKILSGGKEWQASGSDGKCDALGHCKRDGDTYTFYYEFDKKDVEVATGRISSSGEQLYIDAPGFLLDGTWYKTATEAKSAQ